jgi:hypothetical protein
VAQPKGKSPARRLVAGEVLGKPGDRLQSLFIIQSGCIALCNSKGGRLVEISRCYSPACIGDEALFGQGLWNVTAIAVRDTTVLEMSLDVMKGQLQSNPLLPLLMRALSDRAKAVFAELRAIKSNRDQVPCPGDSTAKLFGVIYHSARILADLKKGEDGEPSVDWAELKKIASELFEEPSWRLEDGVTILVKLGYAKVEGAKLHFLEMRQLEAFFDYFGSYHFKGGSEELLRTNSKSTKVTEAFLKVAERYPVDRGGFAHLPFTETIEDLKAMLGKTFEADQLFRLEQKGLFIKRTATQHGGVLAFYRPDFEQMLRNWKILRELETWNETGFIEPAQGAVLQGMAESLPEHVAERKKWAKLLANWKPAVTASGSLPELRKGTKKPGEIWCSICMSPLKKGQGLCEVCGAEASEAA